MNETEMNETEMNETEMKKALHTGLVQQCLFCDSFRKILKCHPAVCVWVLPVFRCRSRLR